RSMASRQTRNSWCGRILLPFAASRATSGSRLSSYPLLLLLVVLDLGELGVDHVVGCLACVGRAGVAGTVALPGRGGGREQRLRNFLQGLGLRLDLVLVVALHRGLDLGDRRLDAADQVARHLVAVFLDDAAGAVHQGIGLVAGADQLLELPVVLAVRLG